ncbi:MAG: NAD(P)/FAD-dependent oxidoreductase [Desulfuromonadaceae bacterium]|nr:NAD(P)/FAD-dependent oxidoreductase [Desulfuromonadaceae bacterium]
MQSDSIYDVAVIGAGVSGLSCALLLARHGKKVVVLEQHPRLAPVLRGFKRKGVFFDSGFHYVGGLGDDGPVWPLLRYLGLDAGLEFTPFNPEGFDCLHNCATGQRQCLPVGFDNIRIQLSARFPGAAGDIKEYLDAIERSWCSVPYLDLDLDLNDVGNASVHGATLKEALARFAPWPELQGLLSMHCLLYGIEPSQALTSLNAQVAGSYYHSAHGIRGGGGALVQTYAERLAVAGVEVRCSAEVSQIITQAGGVSGICLSDGTRIQVSEIVASMNPALLPQMLPDGAVRPAYLKRLRNLRQTSSAYVLFAACSNPVQMLHGCNLFSQREAGLFDPGLNQVIEQRPLFLAAAAPQGKCADPEERGGNKIRHGVVAIVPAAYSEVAAFWSGLHQRKYGYESRKKEIGATISSRVRTCCPELESLEQVELATPLTLQDYSMAPAGAIYGVGRFAGQYNPQPVTRLSGLYLSGQAIAAPGLLGALVGAYMTCGSMLGHDLLRGELKKWR